MITRSRRALLAGGLSILSPWAAVAQSASSVALIQNGETAELVAIGADPQTLFPAASIGKVVTAGVVLRLVEQGRLGLDTPVNDRPRSWTLPGAGAFDAYRQDRFTSAD